MSTITVYGATGMIGSAIAKEAIRRGHTVVGVARHTPAEPLDGVTYAVGELADTARVVERAEAGDVLVISIPPDRTGGPHEPLLRAHRDLIAAAPRVRVFVVGGAGSLLDENGRPLVEAPGFPEAYKAEATTFTALLDDYRAAADGLDWVMESPAPEIGPGEAAAKHVVGGDSPVGDFVTSGTFAVAALDEIEKPSVRRGRFTVADA